MDSSSIYHFQPDITPPQAGQKNRDGLGKGFVRLVLDEGDKPVGYWEGHYSGKYSVDISGPSYSDTIAFGRLVPYS
ncbi:MAG: hypothetical protein AB2L14_12035 [Candidatus Xenobiia bacterium LiM19]